MSKLSYIPTAPVCVYPLILFVVFFYAKVAVFSGQIYCFSFIASGFYIKEKFSLFPGYKRMTHVF